MHYGCLPGGKGGNVETGSHGLGLQCFRLYSSDHAAVTSRFWSHFAADAEC